MIYLLDTSVIMSALVEDSHTRRSQDWMVGQSGQLCICTWAVTELSSALAMKLRMKTLSDRDRLVSLRLFDDMKKLELGIVDVTRDDFEQAARLCDDFELGLRAPDALHLAVAARTARTLVTLDHKLAGAASILGYKTMVP